MPPGGPAAGHGPQDPSREAQEEASGLGRPAASSQGVRGAGALPQAESTSTPAPPGVWSACTEGGCPPTPSPTPALARGAGLGTAESPASALLLETETRSSPDSGLAWAWAAVSRWARAPGGPAPPSARGGTIDPRGGGPSRWRAACPHRPLCRLPAPSLCALLTSRSDGAAGPNRQDGQARVCLGARPPARGACSAGPSIRVHPWGWRSLPPGLDETLGGRP